MDRCSSHLQLELRTDSRIFSSDKSMCANVSGGKLAQRLALCSPIVFVLLFFAAAATHGAELTNARALYVSGQYKAATAECEQAIASFEYEEEWRTLLVKSLMASGQYEKAGGIISNALERYSWSIPIRLLAHEVLPYAGETNRAAEVLREIETLVGARTDNRVRDAATMIAIGKAILLLGADPRKVLDNLFEPARKAAPDNREVYLAMGQLALDKHDFELAAKQFNAGLKKYPNDPDLHFGLAEAFQTGDRKQMLKHVNATLEQNTNHIGALLLLARHLIAGEEYEEAEKLLQRAFDVNPWRPEAWSYRAVLAHLRSDAGEEKTAREKALKYWHTNPEVDYLIGQNLSQKYRFAEGAAYQRRALEFDSNYVPARAQLAEDLLRLGDETEGWRLAEEAHAADEYDVTSYNLVTLKDKLAKYRTLTNSDFILRMATNEAPVYGEQVLELLVRAKSSLVDRYGITLPRPTTVEIFSEQRDFGVRTFGIPDNPGFLGVCFGAVVTANSPATQTGMPANWEAVLWHEFTHVITLTMTKNKMPRWLSEGISVHEELQANPSWGQRMTVRYREMVLGDDFVPIGELSSAFLAPKTPMHLQFAYYESALAVEFIVKNYSFDALKKILHDLGEGVEINKAIETHTAELAALEESFEKFARQRAESLAPGLDFTKPEPADLRSTNWLAANPTNYWAIQRRIVNSFAQKEWSNAIPPLKLLTELFPTQGGDDGAWVLLARAHRELGDTNSERAALIKAAALDSDLPDVYLRLAELGLAAKDWNLVYQNARRALAVNPLVPHPHRLLAQSAEAEGHDADAIVANRTLLRLDPPDPAETHYRLARLLQKKNDPEARRHVLQALEEAPRYHDALRLLRELQSQPPPQGTPK